MLRDVRLDIVAVATAAAREPAFHSRWDYTEAIPPALDWLNLPPTTYPSRVQTDCGKGVSFCYYQGGALHDPNGYPTWHTPGPRFTGTLLAAGRRLSGPAEAIPADILIIGPGTGWHAMMVVEAGPDPLCFSHGKPGDPVLVNASLDLRQPHTYLRYDTTGVGPPKPSTARILYWRKPVPMRGPDVDALRVRLGLQGPQQHGYFGFGTDRAVRQFQRRRGLQVDGIVGPVTRVALGL